VCVGLSRDADTSDLKLCFDKFYRGFLFLEWRVAGFLILGGGTDLQYPRVKDRGLFVGVRRKLNFLCGGAVFFYF
jgi:hypothetical protein